MASRTSSPTTQSPQDVAALFGDSVLAGGFDRIVSKIFSIDPISTYDDLEFSLKLNVNPERADYGTLAQALNEAEDNARRAHLLFVNAKLQLEVTKADVDTLQGALYLEAREQLTRTKIEGKASKTITNDDVNATMAVNHPEEVMKYATRISKAKLTVEHLERLSDLWKSRAHSIDTLVKGARR